MSEKKISRLIPLTKWNDYHVWPTEGGLRYLVANAKKKKFKHVFVKAVDEFLLMKIYSSNGPNLMEHKSMNLTEFLSLIEFKTGYKPKASGKGFSAKCPCHDDKRPSLSIA